MWECSSGIAEACLEGGPFDAPKQHDGNDVCEPCHDALHEPTADELPFGTTD